MNHYSVKPIRLDLRPSRQLALLLGLGVLLALASTLLLPIALVWKMLLGTLFISVTLFHLARDAHLRMAASILAVEVASNGTLRFLSRKQGWCDATVNGNSFVTPWLTILNLQEAGKQRAKSLIVMSDSGDAEMFRRLRVWLRWGSQVLPREK